MAGILVKLDEIYTRLPAVACKGLCQASCTGPIPASRTERVRVSRAGRQLPFTQQACENLTDAGTCGVYEVRPLICRLWGAVENMPCPHGCEPEDGLLTVAEGGALVAAAVEIVGEAQ